MESLEELQLQLEQKIARLDEERKANAAQFEKERQAAIQFAAMEKAKQVEAYNHKVAQEQKKIADQEAIARERVRQEYAARLEDERKQNEKQENLRLQREKLEHLNQEIAKAEFIEEQHRKAMESVRIIPLSPVISSTINVEHPEAPLNMLAPGEAVSGTEGVTPDTPFMTTHLRHILRQANRE